MADAAGCQKSFLSLVLNAHAHLTPEHALGIARFWKLGDQERDYFLELVHFARAGAKELREYIKAKLDRMKSESEHLGKKFQKENLPAASDATQVYYSSWHYSAIHILLTIPKYRQIRAIAERLHLPEGLVTQALERLRELGLAKETKNGAWEATRKNIHLSKDSLLNTINNGHWRQRAQSDCLLGRPESIHYTGVYSLSIEDFQRVRDLTFGLIERSRRIVEPSAEEEVVCLACDLFVV